VGDSRQATTTFALVTQHHTLPHHTGTAERRGVGGDDDAILLAKAAPADIIR